jgi:light-regulated signal transduction histidine kinase (bacteriophytochrome)
LIEDLLKFSALGRKPIEKQRIAMTPLVREIAAGQLLSAPPGTDLRVDDLPSVEGDRSLLGQVWTNLISNALKYAASRRPAVIRISGSLDGGTATFRIEDNGVGFNMKYYDKLFGVFQRLHHADEFPGTGVGLAIVQSIVARHGGRVWAHGVPGEGAVFFFTLPAGDAN